MRIAYLVFHDITKNDGVTKKVKGQVEEWTSLNSNVKVFCFLPKMGTSILNASQYEYGGYINMRFFKNQTFLNDIEEFTPDIVYFRYDSWNINLVCAMKGRVSVAELNSLDLNEYKLLFKTEKTIKSWLRYLGYYLGRNILLKQITGFVGVTREIASHPSYSKFGGESIVIPNGINFNEFDKVKAQSRATQRLSLFFIGTPNQPWHGLDIIQSWANNLKEFDFHIVGMSGKSTDNLTYHGYLDRFEYLKVLKATHICIGSLALFRNGMEEACPLKVREYLAYGFPTIIGYKDSSFDWDKNKPDFILQLNREDLFNYELVKEFAVKMKDRIVHSEEIQQISTSNLEKNRIQFFQKLHKENL